ncbi:nucleotidyl transferase AbiEii/AbiGii toxin family protein [Micrococcaceae bacterium RIT802]|nr:nucleotidyl transferase AbiEii/AbiGii toxin family protein [Micrococcaceae bacterium RIT 802]
MFNDLRNLAARTGRDPAEYYTLYALEGFLRRLTVSAFANDFVLKGGVLMAAFAGRRPTRDIDLAASGISNDIPAVEQRVRRIVAIPAEDGWSSAMSRWWARRFARPQTSVACG